MIKKHLRNSKVPDNPKESKRIQKIPKEFKRFEKISKNFHRNPKDSEKFPKILKDSKISAVLLPTTQKTLFVKLKALLCPLKN